MDQKVMDDIKLAFACDLHETIKAARKNRDESVFRHSMADEDGQMVFASVFPKKEIMEFPDMSDDFVAKLKTFNLLGVITDGKSGLDMFYLGGMNKPFTQIKRPEDLVKILEAEPLVTFMQMYFQVKGVMIDFTTMDHDEFLQAVQGEVFKNTSFSEMSELEQLLKDYDYDN